MRRRATRTVALAITAGLVLAGCSDDDGDGGDEPTEDVSDAMDDESEPMDEETDATDDETEAMGETLTIVGTDYAYAGFEAEMAAGTTLVLQNESEAEVHEILAFRLSDDEDRALGDLLTLPEEELATTVFTDMRGVALAPPGAISTTLPTPALTIEEPGRYIFVCLIPTGAPADEVMTAVQDFMAAGGEDPAGPAYPETGPPHAANGMFAEVTVS